MEALQVQLPSDLMRRLRQEMLSDETLSEAVEEAVLLWLDKRQAEKTQQERGLLALRQAGIVMDADRQRNLADAIMPHAGSDEPPDRDQTETALARLKVPLSEDILAMRGER
ncbi:hypothetical protein [Candidatus Entotheonella palauensis]|uniref:hypothetical protein n=1 Tax=Candidatus Entotheonella palauensis TaxID=93172 RepID=UPI000B7C986A|nr:hypothetical protein [Candidatus Entotheonella palauensis]